MISTERPTPARRSPGRTRQPVQSAGARLQEGWVLANHILVAFHAAFISSVLALPSIEVSKSEVLRFIFASSETIVSALFVYVTFHVAVSLHEIGHFLTAARLHALNESILRGVQEQLGQGGLGRALYLAKLFVLAPWGRAVGIKRQGLNYYPDAPYNLAVAAAGPRASRNVAAVTLPPAIVLLAVGLGASSIPAIYLGRLLLGIGIVTGLDFLIADRGKYREFRDREKKAHEAAAALAPSGGWADRAAQAKQRLIEQRMQQVLHPDLGPLRAPWQFRNCGMGGRHTEKEYPESNISMQEAMFLIIGARDYLDAQEMTIALQTRLKEIIENAEGCRVMGIGLEGGLAPYIDPGNTPLPEVRLWVMMKQAIEECGYVPGEEVAIALDPAMSELEIAYRKEFGVPDSVGMYLFWRDERKVVLDRDGVLDLFERTIREFEVPVLSIEDGFSEDDHEGWKKLNQRLGDRLLIVGDDLVTTNDATIERAADQGLVNAALIKANQIGTLHETVLAMLVALGKGLQLVVSHRSKSPNDDMEAHIALATNSLGLKAGGGANTERLVKYHAVATQVAQVQRGAVGGRPVEHGAVVEDLWASEEPTNAGIPTVGAEVEVALSEGVRMSFRGATPLGTSAGSGEAVHLVDGVFESAEHVEVLAAHTALLEEVEPGVFAFRKEVTPAQIEEKRDDALTELYERTRRYQGKGCLNAVDNVREVIAPYFRGRDLSGASFLDLDRALLQLERSTAERRGKTSGDPVALMQRKQNLGMNAVLSVSLALARATAYARGQQLWELLREEMVGVVEKLADREGVPIAGSGWEDYVAALRESTRILAERGASLHQELRTLTQVYEDPKLPPPSSLALPRAAAPRKPGTQTLEVPSAAPAPAAPVAALPERPAPRAEVALSRAEQDALERISRTLHRSYVLGDDARERCNALRDFIRFRTDTMRRVRPFEILNNKVVRDGQKLLVPYRVAAGLFTHLVEGDRVQVAYRLLRLGTIVTDDLLRTLTGVRGDVIDLEEDLFGYDVESAPQVKVSRIRDLAALLQELNKTANYYKAAIYLRCLVVRLCGRSFRGFLGAKNLLPEVRQLEAEFVKVLNGPFADRLKLPMRVLVRNVSALLIRPSVIDEVWSDAIELAEVQVRGSQIANELRRSSHHALGAGTLALARAYDDYLRTGSLDGLGPLGFSEASEADDRARRQTAARALVERILHNLERLLGTSEILGRIREWQDIYAEGLVRCEFGNVLDEELGVVLDGGIRGRNCWVFRHHLRIIGRKAEEVALLLDGYDPGRELKALEALDPAADGFDAAQAEAAVTGIVTRLVTTLRERGQAPLFSALDDALAAFGRGAFLDTIRRISRLRAEVDDRIEAGGFREQRYLLYQLDCLLEEMAYLAIRNIADSYEKHGVLLDECFEIVQIAAGNLVHGGLRSDELCELASMLRTPGRSDAEVLNVLDALQDCYHRVVHRNSLSYETLGQRLELAADDLRVVLADLQRYMHDLNSIAHLTDLARHEIRTRIERPRHAAEARSEAATRDLVPFAVLHFSHQEEIDRRIEDPAVCLRDLYGGKGGGLLRISHAGIPTRDGFVFPTDLARSGIHERDPARFEAELGAHLEILERDLAEREEAQLRFGDPSAPLLLAVRGGSVFSMPGVLPTVLFVGMNDEVAAALAAEDPWYAYDAYRRFLTSWGGAVLGVDLERFNLVEEAKRRCGARYKEEMPWEAMRDVASRCKEILRDAGFGERLGEALGSPRRQLAEATRAVITAWHSERATRYRAIKGLSDCWQTAVIVQQMASGNRRNEEVRVGMDETRASLTGVIPHTMVTRLGLHRLTGDVKFSASGEDLVGGLTAADSFESIERLRSLMPTLERALDHIGTRIRMHRGTDVELEFTVERGVLSVLQARTAATTLQETVRAFDAAGEPIALGIGIRGGAFRGRAAFDEADLAELEQAGANGADGVLVLLENPTPGEIPLILSAGGLLAARGGSTSHAAVAVHGIQDRPYSAVVGTTALRVDAAAHRAIVVGPEGRELARIEKGDVVSIDGSTGAVWIGSRALLELPSEPGTAGPGPSGGGRG